MSQEKLGLLLQLIGVGLFTPFVFTAILRFLYTVSTSATIRVAEILTRSPVVGQFLADIYLQSMDRLTKGVQLKKMVIQLAWATITVLISSTALIGFLGLPILGISIFTWVPKWMQVVAFIAITLLVLDILITGIWGFFIYKTRVGQSMVSNLPSGKLSLFSLALSNPSKFRSPKKIAANIIFFFVYPVGGLILVTLEFTLLVGSLANRFQKVSNIAGILGWIIIIVGLIMQLLA